MTSAILATENPGWGFFGTVARLGAKVVAGAVWEAAFAAVGAATGGAPEEVQAFLDSRHGRHFADDVANCLNSRDDLATAIDAAVAPLDGRADRPQDQPRDRHPRGAAAS